jgi:hypothetical protein
MRPRAALALVACAIASDACAKASASARDGARWRKASRAFPAFVLNMPQVRSYAQSVWSVFSAFFAGEKSACSCPSSKLFVTFIVLKCTIPQFFEIIFHLKSYL